MKQRSTIDNGRPANADDAVGLFYKAAKNYLFGQISQVEFSTIAGNLLFYSHLYKFLVRHYPYVATLMDDCANIEWTSVIEYLPTLRQRLKLWSKTVDEEV